MSTRERLAAACAGDERALTELLAAHLGQLTARVRGQIPDRLRALLDPEDIVQETCTDAFLAIGGFEPDGDQAFAAWLWTLARRNVVDAVRLLEAQKRGGRRRDDVPAAAGDSRIALADFLQAASITSPSQHAERGERAAAVQQAIAALPQPHRTVVERCDLLGHPVADVARALGRTPGAVFLLRHRAHDWLRQRLGGDGSGGAASSSGGSTA